MTRVPVNSTMFVSIGFEAEEGTLEVEFVKGGTYRYYEVPELLYSGLVLAASKGTFFNRNIEGRYRYSKVWDGSTD